MAEAKDGCVKPGKGSHQVGGNQDFSTRTNSKGGNQNDRSSWKASTRL